MVRIDKPYYTNFIPCALEEVASDKSFTATAYNMLCVLCSHISRGNSLLAVDSDGETPLDIKTISEIMNKTEKTCKKTINKMIESEMIIQKDNGYYFNVFIARREDEDEGITPFQLNMFQKTKWFKLFEDHYPVVIQG